MAAPRSLPTHDAHVASPEVRKAVESRLLSRGIRKDVEDKTQDVLRELFETTTPPPTLEGCVALGLHVANQRAMDHFRKAARRQKHNVGPTDEADQHSLESPTAPSLRDPLDAKKQLEVLERQIADGLLSPRQVKIVMGVADGLDQAELARRLKLSHQTVRNDYSSARRVLRSAWARYVAAATVTLVALACLLYWLRDSYNEAAPAPTPPEPSSIPEVPQEPTPIEEGRDLRLQAMHECDTGNYSKCLAGLDAAAEKDPEGDATPIVRRYRERASKAIEGTAPGRDGKPRRP